MRSIYPLFLLMLLSVAGVAQTTLIDFEDGAPMLVDFNGSVTTVIANPDMTAPNTSDSVAQNIVPVGGQFSGVNIPFVVDFADGKKFTMQVWSPVSNLPVLLKFEGAVNTERAANFTGAAGTWQALTFLFLEEADISFESISIFMNFNVVPQQELTFYWDDLIQEFVPPPPGDQMELPVTFDSDDVNYGLVGFEGAVGNIVAGPEESVNMVGQITKGSGSGTSSGATVTSLPGGPAGFASAIPFAAGATTMSVRVWSPEAGIPVRLKVEKADDPTVSVESQVMLDVAMAWDTLVFDFAQEATGTAAINFNSVYNKASLFFRFGSVPAETTNYFFDNLSFGPVPQGETPSAVTTPVMGLLEVYPNPASDRLTITAPARMQQISLYDITGKLASRWTVNADRLELNLEQLSPGLYVAVVETTDGPMSVKIMKE